MENYLSLTPAAQEWLKSQPPNTINRLIELAAGDTWLALRIAKTLALKHPDRRHKKRGRPLAVVEQSLDDRLMALRAGGMTYAAIGNEVGLDRRWVSERIKRINNAQTNAQPKTHPPEAALEDGSREGISSRLPSAP